jgi:hypothetical protein
MINHKKILAIFITVLIILLPLVFIFTDREYFSENENRYLSNFPRFQFERLKDGTYMDKLKDYLVDHFPLRSRFIRIKTSFEKIIGKKEINNVYIAADGYLIEKYAKPNNKDALISKLNNFHTNIDHVELSLMLVPTSLSINREKLHKYTPVISQIDSINYIYSNINFNTINIYDVLKKENSNYQMFYRLDHHWTTFGAYFAYLEYCYNRQIQPINISDFEIEEVTDNFRGTIYSKVLDNSIEADKIHLFNLNSLDVTVQYVMTNKTTNSVYEKNHLEKKDKYAVFLDNNHPLITITNNNLTNNTEVAVIKDSYANSFIPFLVSHYQKVHVIDPRFYKESISMYIKENKLIKDILILYNINTIDNDYGIMTID